MKTSNAIVLAAGLSGLLWATTGCQTTGKPSQDVNILRIITNSPQSDIVILGKRVTFEVGHTSLTLAKPLYQWFRNGVELTDGEGVYGARDKRLVIASATQRDVGFYQCAVEHTRGESRQVDLSEQAELLVVAPGASVTPGEKHSSLMAATMAAGFTVYGTPIGGGGGPGSGGCPPQYKGYVNFRKPAYPYGWKPNTAGNSASCATTGAVVRYFGSTAANNGCGTGTVTVSNLTQFYRFTVYFTDSVPSGPVALTLVGFDQ